ncbi:RASL10B [Lepeophtheirus salmonis]|uniref:RASL10B n=1 Tax=Lepeophtheirus salmonis TaxID=72036 RepID=A0A7R8CTU6_LEPSM|nr:RASL10B [Lepeophtheirus salmonis]CAF2929727.1 RASL10B [Lepeophtheirus salmonis]
MSPENANLIEDAPSSATPINPPTSSSSDPQSDNMGLTPTRGAPPSIFNPFLHAKSCNMVVLGAQGVGKTSIVRRFVRNEYSLSYERSTSKSEYFPSLILNERLFELKIIDLPVIPYFPASTAMEWTPELRYYGLRSAGAYVLVYDSPATFQFLKTLKEQICASRDMSNIPVIVVANKIDLLPSGGKKLLASQERKEIVHLVKKTWRMSHIECSAKCNWNVSNVFRELAVTLDMIANGEVIRSQHSVRKRRCLMF